MNRLTTDGMPLEQPLRRSIAGRLVFWFLVIALIPCAILTAITARIASTALEGSVRANLVQIAAAKAGEIEAYAAERVRDGMALARGPTFIRGLRSLATIPGADGERRRLAAAGGEFADYFSYVSKAFGYEQLLLIDSSGRVVFALDESIPVGAPLLAGGLASSELATGFDRARTLLQADLGGFQTYGRAGRPLAFVTCPIFDEGRVSGVLALGIGPDRIWKSLSDLSGLGDTGEIVAGQLIGNSVLVTVPLRHAPDAAFRMQVQLGSPAAVGTQRAANGERGYGLVADYRGEQVAAAWNYLPSFRWGMVVKQDADEAFGLVRFQRAAILGLSLATIAGVTLAALLVARTISNPIRTAVDVAKQVAGGDLRAEV
ncbi:hypothetical protein EBR04_07160, partial [bacterium]|nr:hypothetical protein [bacterium]